MQQKAKTLSPGIVLEDGWWGSYTVTDVQTYTTVDPRGTPHEMVLVTVQQAGASRTMCFAADQDVHTAF